MAFRTILAHAQNTEPGAALLSAAADFAATHEAHLIALLLAAEPSLPYSSMVDVPVTSYVDELAEVRATAHSDAEAIRTALDRFGISSEVRELCRPAGLRGVEFALNARYADLSVFGPRDEHENWHQLLDTTLFESGKPVLVCPQGGSLGGVGKRIAVAWDAGREAARAVADALPLIAAAEDVRIVTIDPHVSADRHGEEPGADLATMLSRHNGNVSVDAVPSADRSYSGALLRHVRDVDADLIVAGAYGHSRVGQMLLGGTTRDLMEISDKPVFMSH